MRCALVYSRNSHYRANPGNLPPSTRGRESMAPSGWRLKSRLLRELSRFRFLYSQPFWRTAKHPQRNVHLMALVAATSPRAAQLLPAPILVQHPNIRTSVTKGVIRTLPTSTPTISGWATTPGAMIPTTTSIILGSMVALPGALVVATSGILLAAAHHVSGSAALLQRCSV
jgi:hypothetical protein